MQDKFVFDWRDGEACARNIAPTLEAMVCEEPLPCALLCAAYIDNCLKGLIETAFIDSGTNPSSNTMENALSMNGFLGPTHNRAALAYCLGLIDKPTLTNIQAIAKVRNRFAHSHTPITFSDSKVVEFCKQLKHPGSTRYPLYLSPSVGKVHESQPPSEPQRQFIQIALATALNMTTSPSRIERSRKSKS